MRVLSPKQIKELRAFMKDKDKAGSTRDRADFVLRAGRGIAESQIADELGSDIRTVRKWIRRYKAQGIAGLEDAPRTGRVPSITPERSAAIIRARKTRDSDDKPPSIDALSESFGISRSAVQRILKKAGVMPPRRVSLDEQFIRERVKSAPNSYYRRMGRRHLKGELRARRAERPR